MSLTTPTKQEVLAAAAKIVNAFAATNTEEYFSLFAPEASFIFHPETSRLDDRASYETLWKSWLADGWQVTSCESSDQLVQVFPGGAVFSHTVATSVRSGLDPANYVTDSYVERESIIFRLEEDGSLLAIHEHLSTVPEQAAAPTQGESA